MTPAVRNAYEVLDREAAMGSQGLVCRPGADRERFDPEGVFKSSKERAVGFALPSEDDILAPLRVLSFWKMKQAPATLEKPVRSHSSAIFKGGLEPAISASTSWVIASGVLWSQRRWLDHAKGELWSSRYTP